MIGVVGLVVFANGVAGVRSVARDFVSLVFFISNVLVQMS